MSADPETIAYYDRDARDYAQSAIDHGERASLMAFEARLPRGARVLDLGCGGGHESAWLRDHGHLVTSMDASPGLAAEAKRRWNIDVRVADFGALDEIGAYDGVSSSAALHHAPAADLPRILADIARALKPGGVFSATMKGGANRRDGFNRFYCAMDAAGVRALFADETVWTDVNIAEGVGAGHDGVETPWFVIAARRV